MAWESLSKSEVQRDSDRKASSWFCSNCPADPVRAQPPRCTLRGHSHLQACPGVGGLVP